MAVRNLKKRPDSPSELSWQEHLYQAVDKMCWEFSNTVPEHHTKDTPKRVVKAFQEYFSGVHKDPSKELRTFFSNSTQYDEMVVVSGIDFSSWCAHHLAVFTGKYTFAYLPDRYVVGLSKIPRFIDVLCHRPQIQEDLAQSIVNIFQGKVKPKGCGVLMDAVHTCACTRGVKKRFNTRTTALRGCFKNGDVKAEFLAAVGR